MTDFSLTFLIKLHDGQSAIVDEADRHIVSSRKWYAMKSGDKLYAAFVENVNGKSKTTYMHRLIQGAGEGQCVDHKNGNSLDNRRSNLRIATESQNMQNVGITKANTSGYKGVHWHSAASKWHARIRVDGKRLHLGLFDAAEDAHAAYSAAAQKHHGKFANTDLRISRLEKEIL